MTTRLTPSWRTALALAAAVLVSTGVHAKVGPDHGAPYTPPANLNKGAATCTLGTNEIDLNINNVRATLYNIGGLFWRGANAQYEVPAGGGAVSIFASGIWIGGLAEGNPSDVRFAGATYRNWEYWPGPLDATGETTNERCSAFDKFWKVNFVDIDSFNNGVEEGTEVNGIEVSYTDLRSWPIAQGAPFYVDANGNGRRDVGDEDGNGEEPRIELNVGDDGYSIEFGQGRPIDLAAGERPDIIGDQGIWWVMNDNGNAHGWSTLPALKVEVRALAFGFSTADAIDNTTFYRYQFINKNNIEFTDTYIALWSDPDLGDFQDDYVGSDLDLGLGFVYNGDAFDGGAGGYGSLPPALGYDFFQGPLVNDDGIDNDGDGETDEEDERLAVEVFFYFTNQGGPTGDPATGEGLEAYGYMQAFWKDDTPMTRGGDGYNPGSTDRALFAFPDDPPSFWSEYNSDGLGRANSPDDRRFGVSTGPFTFEPNEIQEIVFGIVWSQAPEACRSTATPQIASLQQLKFDDVTVQGAFNADFSLPSAPPAVEVAATPLDQAVILEWDSVTGDNQDLFQYEVDSPFAEDGAPDDTYNFEGFQIFQYRNESDQEGTLVATFDLNNSVTTIVDQTLDCNTGAIVTGVVAQGNNSGGITNTPTSILIEQDAFTQQELRNNTSYFYGVQPYAYNEFSSPNRVFAAPVTRIEVRPSLVAARGNGTVIRSEVRDAVAGLAAEGNGGQGQIGARVVNPGAITGDEYRVEFFTQLDEDGNNVGTNYRIINVTTGAVILDGEEYYAERGEVLEQTSDVARADGLAFDVQGPPADLDGFLTTENANGPIAEQGPLFQVTGAAPTYRGYPAPEDPYSLPFIEANGIADHQPQQITRVTDSQIGWFLGPDNFFTSLYGIDSDDNLAYDGTFLDISGLDFNKVGAFDYELRFPEGGGQGFIFLQPSTANPGRIALGAQLIDVPFEMWRLGPAPGPADDVRLLPGIFDYDGNGEFNLLTEASFDAGLLGDPAVEDEADSGLSSLDNDPYTDGFFWIVPLGDDAGLTGEAFYQAQLDRIAADAGAAAGAFLDQTAFAAGSGPFVNAFALTGWNIGDVDAGGYPTDQFPEVGTRMRIQTTKPNVPGDTFTINTSEISVQRNDQTVADEALDLIAIVPNPYLGASEYEARGTANVARFVNLPAQATIRIFSLNGTLLRTIRKADPAETTIDWNLRTEANLPVASGVYLIHVEARRDDGSVIGERVLKFGVVQRRVQLDVF